MAIIAKAQITTALELMTYEDTLLSNVFDLSAQLVLACYNHLSSNHSILSLFSSSGNRVKPGIFFHTMELVPHDSSSKNGIRSFVNPVNCFSKLKCATLDNILQAKIPLHLLIPALLRL